MKQTYFHQTLWKFTLVLLCTAVIGLCATNLGAQAAEEGGGLAAIKNFLVTRTDRMAVAGHDYEKNAEAYQKIIDANGGDYNKAAINSGPELLSLIVKMQTDFHGYHNNGYETVEGITAGTKALVEFDNYLDAGVPKSQASTDSPSSSLVLKAADGRIISDRNGNLFHYVIEPTLWGTRRTFVTPVNSEASKHLRGLTELPRADVVSASAKECAKKLDELAAASKAWQPTMDECVGALVWMTPTLNGYFDDWKDSRYNPNAAAEKYVAESRVVDMRGIMSSLQLVYNAIMPQIAQKDPALAARLKVEYAKIMSFIDDVEARESNGHSKLNIAQIEELAVQAKTITDQLTPQLKQVVALLKLKLPPKPILA